MVLHHVGLYWIIRLNQEPNFYLQLHCTSWVINIPCYNTTICSQLQGLLFEDYVKTTRRERYNLMCSIEAHERKHKYVNDEASSGGGRPLPPNSTEDDLISSGLTFNLIESWLK